MKSTMRQFWCICIMTIALCVICFIAIPNYGLWYEQESNKLTVDYMADLIKAGGTYNYGEKIRPSVGSLLLHSWALMSCLVVFVGGLLMAKRRANAFVASFVVFWIGLYVSTPLLRVFVPDFYYSGLLEYVWIVMSILTVVALIVRFVVGPVLWPKAVDYDVEGIGLSDIAPQKGMTVKEIGRGIRAFRPQFLFGPADGDLVQKWSIVAKTIQTLTKTRVRQSWTLIALLVCWPVFIYVVSGGQRGAFDRDVDRMWETETNQERLLVSTPEAMNAAKRAFGVAHTYLQGLTKEDALKVLGYEKLQSDYLFCKPRYDFEANETLVSFSDGKNTSILLAGYTPDKKIQQVWSENGLTLLNRYKKKD